MSFSFDPEYGLIVVTAHLFGPKSRAVLRMALDTGATSSLINATPLEWVGYDSTHHAERVQATTGSGVEFVPLINVQRIVALGQQRTDFPVVCHTLPSSAKVDGLIGLDFFHACSLPIDFRAGEITLD